MSRTTLALTSVSLLGLVGVALAAPTGGSAGPNVSGARTAVAPGSRAVDVVLNVGQGATCHAEEDSGCELVRVRVDLTSAPKLESLTSLVRPNAVGESGSAPVAPAVSPDGSRLAWIERSGGSSQVWARLLGQTQNHFIAKSGKAQDGGVGHRPEWPAWLGNATLLYSAKTSENDGSAMKTVFSVDVSDLESPAQPVKRFGASIDGSAGLQDPNVRMTSSGAEVVSFGPASTSDPDRYSLDVRSLDAAGRPTGPTNVVPRGSNASGKELSACHHPAWNASGSAVLCMAQQPAESVGGIDTKLLYRYDRGSNGQWSTPKRAFEPLTPSQAGMEAASLLSKEAGCTVLSYKYAEYCRGDDWILTTLFCSKGASSSGRGAEMGASRVVLVQSDPVRYVDLTRLVEKERGAAVGGLTSFTGTCAGRD